MNKKIFSVIIPIHNAENTISRTMASLISNQNYIQEIILVNDKTTDDTFERVKPFYGFFENIKVIDSIGSCNPGVARKTGLLKASSDWITFVDADDCLTASSLHYVYDKIISNNTIVLLHCKTIYYESGNFVPTDIEYADTSCGGNFYKRKYLLDHNLLPHDELYMAEDEYFNEKIIKYIKYCDDISELLISHYDYPVYEVHHDIDEGLSFALKNWTDYICKYHLLYKEYLVSDYIHMKNAKDDLLYEFMNSFIFCFFTTQGLILDDDVSFDIKEAKVYFTRALKFYKSTFGKDENFLIKYFYEDDENVNALLNSAFSTIGFEFDVFLSFKKFVKSLDRKIVFPIFS